MSNIKCCSCGQNFKPSFKYGIAYGVDAFICYPDLAERFDKITIEDINNNRELYDSLFELLIIVGEDLPEAIGIPLLRDKLFRSKWCLKDLNKNGISVEFDDINDRVNIGRLN